MKFPKLKYQLTNKLKEIGLGNPKTVLKVMNYYKIRAMIQDVPFKIGKFLEFKNMEFKSMFNTPCIIFPECFHFRTTLDIFARVSI